MKLGPVKTPLAFAIKYSDLHAVGLYLLHKDKKNKAPKGVFVAKPPGPCYNIREAQLRETFACQKFIFCASLLLISQEIDQGYVSWRPL